MSAVSDQRSDDDQREEAKQKLVKIIKSGSRIDETIFEFGEQGLLDETLLEVTFRRLEDARLMEQEPEFIDGLNMVYQRIEAEIARRNSSPAMLLLDKLLKIEAKEGADRARFEMMKAFDGVQVGPQGSIVPMMDGPVDLFATAERLASGEDVLPMPDEDQVPRGMFITEVEEMLTRIAVEEMSETQEHAEALQRVRNILQIAKELQN
ncbi:hypothetical protein CYMTET_48126 [Cymbomonas tetramitiformis]|uniref:Uncharacterized protein n=1 Tax=Cymbomonas tetramitiformis TaxID=36881 RepID=A0AAE0EVB1_9CHLO|nr:hypothetical protein CYMTET_48126 [Cymbomonas tetramitiformis]